MSRGQAASIEPSGVVEVVVRMPAAMLAQIEQYDDDTSYVVRRAVACLMTEEDRQAAALAAQRRRPLGRPRRAS
jgi:hypothetical protein